MLNLHLVSTSAVSPHLLRLFVHLAEPSWMHSWPLSHYWDFAPSALLPSGRELCYILLRTCPHWHGPWWSCQYSCCRSSRHARKPDIWMTSRHWCSWLPSCSCFLFLAKWLDPYTTQQIVRCETVCSGVAVFTSYQERKVMHTHLWIGHTRQTHGHLLHGDLTPICIQCGIYPLLFYISWWNAHVMMKTILRFSFMVHTWHFWRWSSYPICNILTFLNFKPIKYFMVFTKILVIHSFYSYCCRTFVTASCTIVLF